MGKLDFLGMFWAFALRGDLLCPCRQSRQMAQATLSCSFRAIHLVATGAVSEQTTVPQSST